LTIIGLYFDIYLNKFDNIIFYTLQRFICKILNKDQSRQKYGN